MSEANAVTREFRRAMDIVELEYASEPIRVMVVKELGLVEIDGVEYELRRGVELEMPRWLAWALHEEGVVEVLEESITLRDVANVHYATRMARTVSELQQIGTFFYLRVKEYLRRLDEKIRREFDARLLEEKRKIQMYLEEIASKRLLLILQALRSPTGLAEIHEKLTVEERVLADSLRGIVEEWSRRVTASPYEVRSEGESI